MVVQALTWKPPAGGEGHPRKGAGARREQNLTVIISGESLMCLLSPLARLWMRRL